MPEGEAGNKIKTDFFISYNRADQGWAEWIAWQLEEAGYSVVIQGWDFRPGTNFVAEMHRAVEAAERVIAVLSPRYLESAYTQAEWAAAFVRDPTGEKSTLIPLRIEKFDVPGLLSTFVYIDLFSLGEEEARQRLLSAVKQEGRRPATQPSFPENIHVVVTIRPEYPGPSQVVVKTAQDVGPGSPSKGAGVETRGKRSPWWKDPKWQITTALGIVAVLVACYFGYPSWKLSWIQLSERPPVGPSETESQTTTGDVSDHGGALAYIWVQTWGTSSSDAAQALAVDALGGIHVVGTTGLYKFSKDGALIWKDEESGRGYGLAVDAACNVYVAGNHGVRKFDAAGNEQWLAPVGNATDVAFFDPSRIYVVGESVNTRFFFGRLTSTGETVWKHEWEMRGWYYGHGVRVACDSSGNGYMTGGFHGDIDFDPGPETATRIAISQVDFFLCKFDSEGELKWVRTWAGARDTETRGELAVDQDDSIYVVGAFSEPFEFDYGQGTSWIEPRGASDAFVVKFDVEGDRRMIWHWGGDSEVSAESICFGGGGEFYVTGGFWGGVDFDPSETSDFVNVGSFRESIYLSRFDEAGTYVDVLVVKGGEWGSIGLAIDVDEAESVYLAGSFFEGTDFDPGEGVVLGRVEGGRDSFLAKYSREVE